MMMLLKHIEGKPTLADCKRITNQIGTSGSCAVNQTPEGSYGARAAWMMGGIPCGLLSLASTEDEAIALLLHDLLGTLNTKRTMEPLAEFFAKTIIRASETYELSTKAEVIGETVEKAKAFIRHLESCAPYEW